MAKTVLKRLLILIGTLLLVTILAFVAFSVIPGDPTAAVLGVDATAEQVAALRAKLGLDLPLWQRYLNWLGGVVQGDFGESYNYGIPVAQVLSSRAGVTFTLTGLSFLLIVAFSLPLGILSAKHQGGWLDKLLTVLNQITMSVPNFIVGIALVILFSLVLGLFKAGGYVSPQESLWGHLWYLFFPALAIALPRSAMTVKLLRGSILSEMKADYIRTSRSRGSTKSEILWRHVLRNAMIPVITFLATTIAEIVAGSIVVEQVFGVPGLGQMLVTGIGNRDYPLVQAIVLLAAVVVVLCNFLADLLYRVMDPRLRGR